MPRWMGDVPSLGRVQQAAMLWALRKLLEMFDTALIVVRTHPADDEYCTASVETGDPGAVYALAEEYLDLVPVDVDADEDAEDDDE